MTPKQIEALKLALEALELTNRSDMRQVNDAITALEEALAEHAMQETQRLGQEIEQEPVCPDCKAKVLYECVACSSNNYPPQRTEQEPVQFKCTVIDDVHPNGISLEQWTSPPQRTKQEPAGWEVGVVDGVVTRRLAPPQRKPLTVAQIFACENSVPDEIVSDRVWCIYFARAIEAAHDIKENT